VDASEHGAHRAAVRRVGPGDVVPGQESHERGGLAVELAQELAVIVRERARARYAVIGKECHQVEIERKLRSGELLEERQNVAPGRRRDEVVGVLDSGRDATQVKERADVVVDKPGAQFVVGDGRVNGHAYAKLRLYTIDTGGGATLADAPAARTFYLACFRTGVSPTSADGCAYRSYRGA